MSRRSAVVTLAIAVMAGACGKGATPSVAVGNPAPAYRAVTTAGDSLGLDQLKGQVVMLNVWATWCEPCRKEIPALEALHKEFSREGLRVLGVSIDMRSADGDVRRFTEDFGMTLTVLRDPNDRVSRIFRLTGVPNTVLIDRKGLIVRRWIGEFEPLGDSTRAAVRRALESTD